MRQNLACLRDKSQSYPAEHPNAIPPLAEGQREGTTPLLEKMYRGVTSPIRLLPDFLIIGTQRGGTTSLYRYLQAHPCISPASTKEVHFFDMRFHKGLAWYRAHFPSRIEQYAVERLHGHRLVTGEASALYLFHPHTPKRVAETLPSVKLIVLLRNPVDRALSHYYHAIKHGWETLSFEKAIEGEVQRTAQEREKLLADERYESCVYRHRSYLTRGIYVDQLQAWMTLFAREQFLILKSEDFYADPATTLKAVLAFLNIPETQLQLDKQAYRAHNANTYPRMEPALRKRLIAYFEPHNARLYAYLGIDFAWDA
jgi:hypothetical protein